MDNEYGIMFKRLMNERNELRKYIIDICELLDIDTGQSVLGANCLEFYAVLSSTAKDKIKDLQEQLKRKEEELQTQRNFTAQEQRKIYCVAYDKTCETGNECKQKKCVFKDRLKFKQALDEIEQAISNFPSKGIQDIPQTQIECTQYFLSVSETKLQKILDIINKAKRADK